MSDSRTQDLFENVGAEIDHDPVHPLERHKSKARERSKLVKLAQDTNTVGDRNESVPISPSRTPVPRQNKHQAIPLVVDTNLLMNSNHHGYSATSATSLQSPSDPRSALYSEELFQYKAIPTSPMSMSLSVGVFSCEGDLPVWEDLFCTIRIGQSDSAITESAICVPNHQDSSAAEWNQS